MRPCGTVRYGADQRGCTIRPGTRRQCEISRNQTLRQDWTGCGRMIRSLAAMLNGVRRCLAGRHLAAGQSGTRGTDAAATLYVPMPCGAA